MPLLFVAAFVTGAEAAIFAIMGVLAFFPTVHWIVTLGERQEKLRAFYASGDYDAWPFTSRDDLNKAKASPEFLNDVDDAGDS